SGRPPNSISYLCAMRPLSRAARVSEGRTTVPGGRGRRRPLAPQAELLDQGPVARAILALQVAQVAPALPDELEQTSPRAVVLLGARDVLDELVDAGRDQRDLHLGRSGVAFVGRRALDDLDLFLFGQRHVGAGLLSRRRP